MNFININGTRINLDEVLYYHFVEASTRKDDLQFGDTYGQITLVSAMIKIYFNELFYIYIACSEEHLKQLDEALGIN